MQRVRLEIYKNIGYNKKEGREDCAPLFKSPVMIVLELVVSKRLLLVLLYLQSHLSPPFLYRFNKFEVCAAEVS